MLLFEFAKLLFAGVVSCLAVLFGCHFWNEWLPSRVRALRGNAPPIVTGTVPFLGCAIEFGKGPPVSFLEQCRVKLGNVFTLHLAGRHMTFLMHEKYFETFFSPDEMVVDFQPFLTRCFGVSKESYFQSHEEMLSTLRNSLLANRIDCYVGDLGHLFDRQLAQEPWQGEQEAPLLLTLRRLMFHCTVRCLFGEPFESYAETTAAVDEIVSDFHAFDSWFELASSNLPHVTLPAFTKAKSKLIRMLDSFAQAYKHSEGTEPNVAERMRGTLGEEGLQNWLLALLWASEANTIPTLFWLIVHLLSSPARLDLIRMGLEHMLQGRDIEEVTWKELQSCNDLRNAVQETIRLHSPPVIVRAARQPVTVGNFVVPVGHFLCLSPYWAHRSESLYGDDASDWKPERWSTRAPGKAHKYDFLSFGAGKYRCPGQNFAYLSLMLAAAKLLLRFNFKAAPGQDAPSVDERNLVGITKPNADLLVRISPRE